MSSDLLSSIVTYDDFFSNKNFHISSKKKEKKNSHWTAAYTFPDPMFLLFMRVETTLLFQIPVLSNNIAFTNPCSVQQHCFSKPLFCTTILLFQIPFLYNNIALTNLCSVLCLKMNFDVLRRRKLKVNFSIMKIWRSFWNRATQSTTHREKIIIDKFFG